jgi:RNA polymerase sigma factor (sigma-70 family)
VRDPRDQRYEEAAAAHGGALRRLARAFEADAERRRDLLQDMHVALWRSLAQFDGRCSLRTWVYRVAHNVAATHVDRERRTRGPLLSIDDVETLASERDPQGQVEERDALERLRALVRRLKAPDRQIMALYLDGVAAAGIAEITGLSPGAVATRVHRLKAALSRMFREATHVS